MAWRAWAEYRPIFGILSFNSRTTALLPKAEHARVVHAFSLGGDRVRDETGTTRIAPSSVTTVRLDSPLLVLSGVSKSDFANSYRPRL